MPRQLIQLAYSSVATVPFGPAQIESILATSRRQNADHGITGMLLYKSGYIIQVLEGEPENICQLYSNIERDRRHQHVVKLFESLIAAREFGEWSMGFNWAQFGYAGPPEGFNSMLSTFLSAGTAESTDGRGTSLLKMFAATTR